MKKLVIVLSGCLLISSTTPKPIEKPNAALRMYRAIMLYSGMYQVPRHIAFNIAHLETTYRGPQDSTYNPSRVSKMGAMGPMQIMYRYASHFAERKVTKSELRDSIEFNVNLSMKILAQNYKRYKSWKKAAGAYNTGRPIINHYAKEAVKKDYQRNWLQEEEILYSDK
jgi:soluble lytic murein transglycosylase-like protein